MAANYDQLSEEEIEGLFFRPLQELDASEESLRQIHELGRHFYPDDLPEIFDVEFIAAELLQAYEDEFGSWFDEYPEDPEQALHFLERLTELAGNKDEFSDIIEHLSLPASQYTILHDPDFDRFRLRDHFEIAAKDGDTWLSLSEEFAKVAGYSSPEQAQQVIMEANSQMEHITAGAVIAIPVAEGLEVTAIDYTDLADKADEQNLEEVRQKLFAADILHVTLPDGTDASSLKEIRQSGFALPAKTNDELEIEFVNVRDISARPSEQEYVNNTEMTLLVKEQDGFHHHATFSLAEEMSRNLDPDDDQNRIVAYNTPSVGMIWTGWNENDFDAWHQNPDVIYSLSMVSLFGNEIESYQHINAYEEQATHFAAAGNFHVEGRTVFYESAFVGHADKGVVIGAAHLTENGQAYIADYSSGGVAFLAPVHNTQGSFLTGTSFATPNAAASYKEIAEHFGDRLTHAEIMAAGLLATDLNIKNYEIPRPAGDATEVSTVAEPTDSEYAELPNTKFEINAGGVAYHDRAGAGLMNVDRWFENCEKLAFIKASSCGYTEIDERVEIDHTGPSQMTDDGWYEYHIEVPENMTLNNLTLHVGDKLYKDINEYRDMRLISPNGFVAELPATKYAEVVSTRALALEDVDAGDVLRLQTSVPLKEGAFMDIRGFEAGGNPVQALRDKVIAQDPNRTPLTSYEGPNENANHNINQMLDFDHSQQEASAFGLN